MPHDTRRLAVRLDVLSREQLVALAAAGCAADAKLCARADALIAEANPLPSLCVDALLSPDVLSHLLGTLELCDWRVASVCSAWAAGWEAMLAQRRYVNPKPARVQMLAGKYSCCITQMPDGAICLASSSTRPITFLSLDGVALGGGEQMIRSRYALAEAEGSDGGSAKRVAYHRNVLYFSDFMANRIVAFDALLGVQLASAEVRHPSDMAFCGGKLLVALEWESTREIAVLDAQTLELQHTFSTFIDNMTLVVCNNEVYIGSDTQDEICVYNLTGKLRRTLRGAFNGVRSMAFHRERLYILEWDYDASHYDEDEPEPNLSENTKDWAGRRVLVLNLDGELVQEIYPAHPYENGTGERTGNYTQINLDIRSGELHLLYNYQGSASMSTSLVVLRILGDSG